MKKTVLIAMAFVMAGCESVAKSVPANDATVQEEATALEAAVAPKYEYYDAYAHLEGEVYNSEISYDYFRFMDKDYIYDYAENVVIGHVISIDRGSNWNEVDETYCIPYTVGRFAVLKSLKGDLAEGGIYQYGRQGGIVTAQEHYDTYEDKGDKFKRMTGSDPDYIGEFPKDSNRIEVGKTYLMYIIPASGIKDTCAIFGQQCGLREIDELFPEYLTNTKVFNNITEEWESLSDVVPLE